jgi:Tol biopolymer transport system component
VMAMVVNVLRSSLRTCPLPIATMIAIAGAMVSAVAQMVGTPVLFEPGIVSTAAPEFAISFSPEMREVYFNRATPDRRAFPIFRSVFTDGRWTEATPAAFAPDGRNPDPFVTLDGSRLYFSSDRENGNGGLDIWFVERRGSGWSAALNLGPAVNSSANDVFVSATRGGTLYFGSDRSGNSQIYRSYPAGAAFSAPERLPDEINGYRTVSNPAISADEHWLFFAAVDDGGYGESDLYVSERVDGRWSAARNLGESVNSPYADFAPALSPDGTLLFFTSERPGVIKAPSGVRPPGDIYSIPVSALPLVKR